MKKIIFLEGLSVLVIAGILFVSLEDKAPAANQKQASVIEQIVESAPSVIVATSTSVVRHGVAVSSPTTISRGVVRADAVLFVDSKEYPVSLTEDNTLFGVMKQLSQTTDFRYSGKDFSGLGFFVESINGKKSEGGMYWILYVNGVLAGEGVSQLIVKSGDNIEWRYEAEK